MRASAKWMTLTDERILDFLHEHGEKTLQEIRSFHLIYSQRHEIAIRCDILSSYGLVESVDDSDRYKITDMGKAYLFERVDARDLTEQPQPSSSGTQPSWMEDVDHQIIECVAAKEERSEPALVEEVNKYGDWDRETIYHRCMQLSLLGLIRYLGQDEITGRRTYECTDFGNECIEGVPYPNNLRRNVRGITNLTPLEPDDIRFRNQRFLVGDSVYETREQETQAEIKQKIWRVRSSDLNMVLRRFPRDCTLIDQCAFWMRAWTGRHFFPDANHRTAIALLRNILLNRGMPPGRWSTNRSRQAIRESKELRKEIEFTLDSLYLRDEHFMAWKCYFLDVLPAELKQ